MSHDELPSDDPAVVTCGLPYANGDLHIGHLRTYVGGDALSRAFRTIGQQTAFVCGSDMHGTPVAVNAAEAGVDPATYALEYHEEYADLFPKFRVEFDNYGHTDDRTNTELTREIVETLESEGFVEQRPIKVAWDPEAGQSLPDRYVEGTCPYCGERARGDECDEGCGRHLEPGEITDPVSVVTGNPAEYREREHKFFTLSDLADYLAGFIDRLEGTPNARNQPRQWIEDGLQDWCITRDLDWGIEYPGEEELVLYVWVDAPIEYIASTKQYSERVGADRFDWEAVWKDEARTGERRGPIAADTGAGSGGEIVHVIGRDIIQHHTIFWPAMLEVAGYAEPRAVLASGFVNLDGEGFSTSRGRAIWAEEYLEEGFDPDLLRYYLATVADFQHDVDFSWERFQSRVNGELVGNVGNFAYRSLLFAERNFEGCPEGSVSDEVRERIEETLERYRVAIGEYSIREATRAAVELTGFGNEYIQRSEPWNLEASEAAPVIRDCVQIVQAAAVTLYPVVPNTAERLWAQLGHDDPIAEATLEDALAAPPATLGEPTELFDRIEDDRVADLERTLAERVAANTDDEHDDASDAEETEGEGDDIGESAEGPALEPIDDDRVPFDVVEELDIRIGEITTAEPIEDSDDLVRLVVDLGVESRQLVAGIKQLHDIDALPGTRVVVLANLEPAELFGVESDGMLLAAGDEADLLTTHGDAPPGTPVR
ncbi:MAG: methionine--tRNA ligase [Halococcoides sp.]